MLAKWDIHCALQGESQMRRVCPPRTGDVLTWACCNLLPLSVFPSCLLETLEIKQITDLLKVPHSCQVYSHHLSWNVLECSRIFRDCSGMFFTFLPYLLQIFAWITFFQWVLPWPSLFKVQSTGHSHSWSSPSTNTLLFKKYHLLPSNTPYNLLIYFAYDLFWVFPQRQGYLLILFACYIPDT